MLKAEVVKIDVATGKTSRILDYVAEEKPLHLTINKKHYAKIFSSPSNLRELAVGHLISEGIVKSIEEIQEVKFTQAELCNIRTKPSSDIDKRLKLQKSISRIVLSACGSSSAFKTSIRLPKIESKFPVKVEVILSSVKRLNSMAETFRKTGGVHAAAIYKSDGSLVAFAEDVGRHNAVDKVIGIGALNKTDFNECFLALTGRLTGDMVQKAAMVGLPIVASLAAAIASGIAVARDVGLTLVGFARGKRVNIYSSPERILH